MMSSPYQPQPLNTKAMKLPATLLPLLERLAENTHDVWAATRLQQGWTYGPQRDDAQKKHPCLVPYAQLPESEKVLDRNTVEEVLKGMMALGYRIEKAGTS